MAKKTTKSPSKRPLRHRLKTYNFFLVLAALLGMIAGVLLVRAFYHEQLSSAKPTVNIGALGYDFSTGKAVKKDTAVTQSLQSFLMKKAAEDCQAVHNDLLPAQYQVIVANHDVSQVLLGYGCGDTDAHMFAVRNGTSWQLISPTNHFEAMYGLPECSYLESNHISKQIAPVCCSTVKAKTTYHVR